MSKYGIEHVVVLMLENRSFDHLFGFLDHPSAFDGLNGSEWNPVSDTDNAKIMVSKGAKPFIHPDPGHEHTQVLQQMDLYNTKKYNNLGFYYNYATKSKNFKKKIYQKTKPKSNLADIMACWDPTDDHIRNLTFLAKNYVLCDNWFSSVPGETWPNRNYIHAATSDAQVNIKLKFYKNRTIYHALDEAGLSWNIYHDGIAQSMAFIQLQTLNNGGFIHYDKFKKNVAEGKLANYTFIEPRHFNLLKGYSNSMHPGNNSEDSSTDLKAADNLVGEIYNTLTSNKSIWAKTLFIITFDEHGGFYDHKRTRSAYNPGNEIDEKSKFKFNILGVRVPAILISPMFPSQSIDSTEYDHTSVIKSIFENFELPGQLTNRDKNAKTFWHNLISRKPSTGNVEPIKLHRLSKPLVQAEEELNDFQKDLIQLAEEIETSTLSKASAFESSGKKIKKKSTSNQWNHKFMKGKDRLSKDRILELNKAAGKAFGSK